MTALAGCGSAGGGSGGSVAGGVSQGGAGGGTGGSSAVSAAQRAVALAALGATTTSPGGPEIAAPALASWNVLIQKEWVQFQEKLNPALENGIRAQVTGLASGGVVRILGIRNLVIDTSSPMGVGGSTTGSRLALRIAAPLPAGTSWGLSFTADVGSTITTSVLGVPIQVTLSIDVTVAASDVHVTGGFDLDASVPERPRAITGGAPQVAMNLSLTSGDPLFSQIVNPLTQVLDPVIRVALVGGGLYAQTQIAQALPMLNDPPYGTGGPGVQPVPGPRPLADVAEEVSDEILAHHIPFGTLVSAWFDQPVYKQGNLVEYGSFGDSTIWTGHYFMGEALRYDLTQDPRALDGASRAANGLDICVGLSGTPGLLSRNCIPSWSPEFAKNQGGLDWRTGVVNGQLYGGENDISRDQYLGVVMGFSAAYQRVPQLRPIAAKNLAEIVDYLDGMNWHLYQVNQPAEWARFSPAGIQTPGLIYAFTQAAKNADPAGHSALAARYEGISSIVWLGTWGTCREVHEGYYKFNLMHDEQTIITMNETDPTRYRDVAKANQMTFDAIGHHQNAWFDSVRGMMIPAQAQAMGARVKDELDRWVLRPRRGFSIQNSADPTIAKVLYASPLQMSTPPSWVAVNPVPIEKRPFGDFIWQSHAFGLDGGGDPREQQPGADLVGPYWTARSFGLLP